jgi:hypothetical protein
MDFSLFGVLGLVGVLSVCAVIALCRFVLRHLERKEA